MWEGCQHKSSESEEISSNFPLKDGTSAEEMQGIFGVLQPPLPRRSHLLAHDSRLYPSSTELRPHISKNIPKKQNSKPSL